jgi:predicted nucleic-acid-binding protein
MTQCPGSLDANVLLRLILRDLPTQSDLALELLHRKGTFHVADTAMIEVTFALERYYDIPRVDIVTYLKAVVAHPKLSLNRQLFSSALEIYPNHPKLSFEDCCLAIDAELNSALPLWTFDKKLANQLGKHTQIVA